MALAESSVLVRAPCWLARFQKNNSNYMQNPTRIICWSTKLDDQTEGSSASISLTSSKSSQGKETATASHPHGYGRCPHHMHAQQSCENSASLPAALSRVNEPPGIPQQTPPESHACFSLGHCKRVEITVIALNNSGLCLANPRTV